MGEGRPGGHRAATEERAAAGQVGRPTRGCVQHPDEQGKQQQRGAQVALVHQDGETGHPGDRDRDQLADGREDPTHPTGRVRQDRLPLRQIRSEKGRHHQLGDLTRLELEPQGSGLEPDPEPRAALLEASQWKRPVGGQER